MTAQGEGLLAFLDASITMREQAAREAARSYGTRWVRPIDTDMVRVSDDDIWFQALSEEIAEHIVYSDPESVLRRCAADRKLIALHQPMNCSGPSCDCDSCCPTCRWDLTDKPGGGTARCTEVNQCICPCPTLRVLAEGYGWTEGER